MKTKETLVTPCLSAGMLVCAPGMSLADINFVPQNASVVPSTSANMLQQLIWTPADQLKTQSVDLTTGGQRLDVPRTVGPVVAWNVLVNTDELTLTPDSELNKHKRIFIPNVLILDQNMAPTAFFPSNYFTYQQPGVMTADRLGSMTRLTPVLSQQKLHVLMFTTEKDPQRTTTLLGPTKAYAKDVGNVAPDILNSIVKHITDGVLKLKVGTNSTSSVLVGLLFGPSGPGPVTVGNTATPVAASVAAAAAAPAAKGEPMLSDTKTYFNSSIKQAVKQDDIDKALKLVNEVERLGSKSVRSTFISSVKDKG